MRCSSSSPPADSSENADDKPAISQSQTDGPAQQHYILNWAFGRWTFTPSTAVAENADPDVVARITLILARYESAKWTKKIEGGGLVQVDGGDGELVVERLV